MKDANISTLANGLYHNLIYVKAVISIANNKIQSISLLCRSSLFNDVPEVHHISHLKALSLDHNMIETMEPLNRLNTYFLQKLKLCKYLLIIASNRITSIDPIKKVNFKNLEHLDLSTCHLI